MDHGAGAVFEAAVTVAKSSLMIAMLIAISKTSVYNTIQLFYSIFRSKGMLVC